MYINKFSIVDFSPQSTLTEQQQPDLPKKRGRPPKNAPKTNKLMFIKSTETMPMKYELTCEIENQFKKDKRRKADSDTSSSVTSTTLSSTKSEDSNTFSTFVSTQPVRIDACVPTSCSPTMSNTIPLSSTSNNNTSMQRRIIRTSISIKELLN